MRRRLRLKKNRDEPIQDILHIYIEMSPGYSLHSHLKQKYVIFFPLRKSENRRAEQSPD
jgi:hypothetical protein